MVEASLYIHVPFCKKRCPYCHFYVRPTKANEAEAYVQALLAEWKIRAPLFQGKKIVSIYFGGGTPSQLKKSQLEQIYAAIASEAEIASDCEVTLEANPEDVNESLLDLPHIGRISLGVQSFDDALLKRLGRGHTSGEAIEATRLVAERYQNVSIDLMYELPEQTEESWRQTLEIAAELPITHLSLYNLTFEPGTAFMRARERLAPLLPSPATCERLYRMPEEILPLERYEISAFSKPGMRSRHNTGYWQGRPFIGLGPSASSYWNGVRFRAAAHLKNWMAGCHSGELAIDMLDDLPQDARLRELLIIGLRQLEGVKKERFTKLDAEAMNQLSFLKEKGLLESSPSHWRLTERGRLLHDAVAEALI